MHWDECVAKRLGHILAFLPLEIPVLDPKGQSLKWGVDKVFDEMFHRCNIVSWVLYYTMIVHESQE